jgi:hypothetical protein
VTGAACNPPMPPRTKEMKAAANERGINFVPEKTCRFPLHREFFAVATGAKIKEL